MDWTPFRISALATSRASGVAASADRAAHMATMAMLMCFFIGLCFLLMFRRLFYRTRISVKEFAGRRSPLDVRTTPPRRPKILPYRLCRGACLLRIKNMTVYEDLRPRPFCLRQGGAQPTSVPTRLRRVAHSNGSPFASGLARLWSASALARLWSAAIPCRQRATRRSRVGTLPRIDTVRGSKSAIPVFAQVRKSASCSRGR